VPLVAMPLTQHACSCCAFRCCGSCAINCCAVSCCIVSALLAHPLLAAAVPLADAVAGPVDEYEAELNIIANEQNVMKPLL